MGEPAQTIQRSNGSIAVPLLKILLVAVALIALGYSLVNIDLPNRNYVWIVVEIVVAILLILSAVGNLRRVFGSKR